MIHPSGCQLAERRLYIHVDAVRGVSEVNRPL